ncbi:MAG: exodeoxyribonuclease VII small subunit [Bacteroidetes bacterium]|nr:MAG: exodeoxyribonuclease VII small subunit [Bacteroidota bacterium]
MPNDTKNTPVKDLSYDESITELKTILSSLQDEKLSIDDLTVTIKRASELLEFCHSRLKSTEQEVEKIIVKLGLGD